jgi:hypothetical protein
VVKSRREKRKNSEGAIFLALYCLTMPLANWMIGHLGVACRDHGPCMVPVARGLHAPSGVLQIVGKAWMVLLAIPFVTYLRRRDERIGFTPA